MGCGGCYVYRIDKIIISHYSTQILLLKILLIVGIDEYLSLLSR